MELILKNITKKYGNKTVLNDLSAVFSNGISAVLGPNGTGKTTLINIMCGYLKADRGQIIWNGTELTDPKCSFCASVGYVPQTMAVYPFMTAEEYLNYMGLLKGISKSELRDDIVNALKAVNLETAKRYKISALSEGMKRRLLISQALLGNPKIMIMDEPTAGLDPGQRISFKNMIADFSESRIIILATHIVPDVDNLAQDLYFLKNGMLEKMAQKIDRSGKMFHMTPLEKIYNDLYN